VRRLTPAFLTLLMFGVVGLLVAAYIGKTLLAREDTRPPVTNRTLPMANADIQPGTTISAGHIGQGFFPSNRLEPDMLLADRMVVGRVAKELIKAAVPIRANMLYPPGELPPLEVAPGMRAVSVNIGDSVGMVDGMIRPGQYVDVLFTLQQSGMTDDRLQGGLTMRLFEGVKVLAINRNLMQGRPDRDGNHVTLELTEPQSNILVLAKDRGNITLTYNPSGKGDGGLAVSSADRVTLYEILGLKRPDPAKDPFTTEQFRGAGRSLQAFDDKGKRLDSYGTGGGGRAGFDYRGFLGAPAGNNGGYNGMSPGGYLYGPNNGGGWVLPNQGGGSSAPAAPDASGLPPTADRNGGFWQQPGDAQQRSAPTAARAVDLPN
jgi:pilus assembly protein CpaB